MCLQNPQGIGPQTIKTIHCLANKKKGRSILSNVPPLFLYYLHIGNSMVIGGFVVQSIPENRQEVIACLNKLTGVEVYGDNQDGNIVTVVETPTSDDMENLVKKMEKIDFVLNIGLTYLNIEDEAEQIASGKIIPEVFKERKNK